MSKKFTAFITGIVYVGLGMTALFGCAKSDETRLVDAVKQYRLGGVTVEQAIESEINELKKRGEAVEGLEWRAEPDGENGYRLVTVLKSQNAKLASMTYDWGLIKKNNYSDHEVWSLQAQNGLAKTLVRKIQQARFK